MRGVSRMSGDKDSAAKRIFVEVTVAVLSAALLAWFGLSENSPINRSGSDSESDSSSSDTTSSGDQGLQALSNGTHFYGEVGSPNDVGGKYVLFRKAGNTVIGSEYIQNSGHPTCFKGTIDQDSVVNVTFALPPEPGTGGTFWDFETQGRLNLLATYPHSLDDVTPSGNVARFLRECVQVFSNAN